ncbi:MAG: putative transposase, partial [Parvicellaceae bacterium]
FESAQRTLAGIEVVSVIRKSQIEDSKSTTFKTFISLVGLDPPNGRNCPRD